ncbi:MAG: hypothetical protein AB7U75_14430 [Hyphomicrobiaceae bacterium]
MTQAQNIKGLFSSSILAEDVLSGTVALMPETSSALVGSKFKPSPAKPATEWAAPLTGKSAGTVTVNNSILSKTLTDLMPKELVSGLPRPTVSTLTFKDLKFSLTDFQKAMDALCYDKMQPYQKNFFREMYEMSPPLINDDMIDALKLNYSATGRLRTSVPSSTTQFSITSAMMAADPDACEVCNGSGKLNGEECWHCEGEGLDPTK